MSLKKIISFLALTAIVGLVISSLFTMPVSQADFADDIGKLFQTGEKQLTLEYAPGKESLALSEEGYNSSLTATTDAKDFIKKVVNFALGFLGLIAVIIVIYGGVLYVTAGGVDEQTQKAKKAITYATIGLVIILGSFAFVNTIIKGVEGPGDGGGGYVVGENVGGSFNAHASEVHAIARDNYAKFVFLAETFDEMKNIINDSNKTSIGYQAGRRPEDNFYNPISKDNALNFVFSFKQKMQNLRSELLKFSTAYTKTSELIRILDSDIDYIKNAKGENIHIVNGFIKIINNQGGIETCNSTGDIAWDCMEYPYQMIPRMLQIIAEINDSGKPRSLDAILEPIRDDYIKTLKDNLGKLDEIRKELANVDVVQTGKIGQLFTDMMNSYGYNINNPSSILPNSFLASIENWNILMTPEEIDATGRYLFEAIEAQLELYDELQNLKTVEVHLRANITTGNAPLLVTFDVLDSLDPAGGSIVSSNIDWSNIKGSYIDVNDAAQPQETGLPDDAVTCTDRNTVNNELYGPAFTQCEFKYPGTYVAAVKVESNDPATYAPGMSTLVIKVNPPTTKIELKLKTTTHEIPVMSYYDTGILKTDKDYIPITLKEAQSGITFDASDTENVQAYKWDFGVPEGLDITDEESSAPKVKYKLEGKYLTQLEVVSELGEIDRKIFTLDVRKVAARIQVVPSENVYIGKPIIIDGTQSSVSSGTIRSYEWDVTKDGAEVDLKGNENKPSFTHEFKDPGKYEIDLTIVSDLAEPTSAETYELLVKSQPPKAVFKYDIPQDNQPSTVKFNASQSFDPDGKLEDLEYEWKINPDSGAGENWSLVNNSTLTQKDPLIKFRKKGDYIATLKVSDKKTKGPGLIEEFGEITKTISINNTLGVAWSENQEITAILNEDGEAEMNFIFESDNAIAYEINFGDEDTASGDIAGSATVSHTYAQAGRYLCNLTVYDEDDNDNSVERQILIGGGDEPIAQIKLLINGTEIMDLGKPVEVSKEDVLTFDAGESKNADGSGRNLKFSWDFGDTASSSNKSATHSYKEVSPVSPGYYKIKLTVYDKDDPDKSSEDTVRVNVQNAPPVFSSIQAIPTASSGDLITPVTVEMKVYGAEDKDGEITQYKWWYYDVDDPEEPLGIQVTQSPFGKLTIGTRGNEGKTMTYGFGLEIMDTDNLTASSVTLLAEEQVPKVTVINGKNERPTAKFNVDSTSVFTGDKVTFTSASKDPDGRILQYVWDTDGDGFFNNKPTENSVLEYIYKEKNMEGYDVRLKVIDDKGGEAVSAPITIYVDSLAEPPTAAFTFEIIGGTSGNEVKFINNSTADKDSGADIDKYIWDFNTFLDADGDGNKTNDNQSEEISPVVEFTEAGTYTVKLTIIDTLGGKDEVENNINILIGAGLDTGRPQTPNQTQINAVLTTTPPKGLDGIIYLTGESGSITFNFSGSQGPISSYVIDKNIYFDTNGDGVKNNDQDFKTSLPGSWTTNFDKAWGQTTVKLTVVDMYGNENSITQEIKFK